ncbi:SGNH/GDSL hydrolase family protein [Tsukamurella sp. 8F]|nr:MULTISPECIES: SGNH/GDSL hydrolase family protein [unclassified Tsukamurella]MDF0528713.1 SGNH/GDSL hydrolase family protein [Tsukamurella sp. 8J]MDF0585675.1 SGNH/GDSL hydrolase family protein [Tsukamurella sp. 8F]
MTSTQITTELLPGIAELEPTSRGLLPHRLPAHARRQCSDPQMAMAETQPAGARLRFHTTATIVELDVIRTRPMYRGVPARPDGVYDLVVDGTLAAQETSTGGDVLVMDIATGTAETEAGPIGTITFTDLPDRAKTIEIWLPHNEITELVDLRSDRPLSPAAGAGALWVHHGSSISHGSNAAHPTGTWPAIAARRAGLELHNLGFGGGALLDPFVARTIRDASADLISIKLGINLVNADLMRRRAFGPAVHGFLDTIRDGHPTTPLIVVSAVHCPIHEDTPGPVVPDFADGRMRFVAGGDPDGSARGQLTLRIVRAELAELVDARAVDDPHLTYIDGLTLFGPQDADLPLADNLHPGPEAHQRIGERFSAHLRAHRV